MILMDTKEIFWFGTTSTIHKQSKPKKINLSDKIPSIFPAPVASNFGVLTGQSTDFAIVKVNHSWNDSMSLAHLTIADLRSLDKKVSANKI